MNHRHFWTQFGPLALLLCIALTSVVSWGDGTAEADWTAPARASRKKNPIAYDDASVAAGKELYAKQCLSCHGETGKGDGSAAKDLDKKPNDLTLPKVQDQTDGALFWKVTEGKKPMPSFEKMMTDDQRWQTINYLRSLAPKPATKP